MCKVTDLQKYGYAAVLVPLLHDIRSLDQDAVFIESIGQNVKGTIFCVLAHNLAAHGLGGVSSLSEQSRFVDSVWPPTNSFSPMKESLA